MISDCFSFVHIPKTGGTSLSEWLSSHAAGSCDIAHIDLPKDKPQGVQMFFGHRPVPCGVPWLDNMPRFFVLRHPVSQTLSNIQHLARHFQIPLDSSMEWSKCCQVSSRFSNDQTYWLTGIKCSSGILTDTDSRSLVDKCVALLNTSTFGIFEYWDQSISLISGELEIPQTDVPFLKKGGGALPVTKSDIEHVIKNNELDSEIYSEALKIFKDRRDKKTSISFRVHQSKQSRLAMMHKQRH